MELSEYTARHRHFLSTELPPLLAEVASPGTIVDLGCGDGAVIWALYQRGLLGEQTIAVDLAPERVQHAVQVAPGIRGVVASATDVGSTIPDASADGVILSQVIEHVPDEAAVITEIARILRPGGWWYVGTVLRGPRAWWIYEVDGTRRLDPTHVREYSSVDELRRAIAHPSLAISATRTTPFRFPVSDLVVRAAARAGLAPHGEEVYARHRRLERMRWLRLRVPGYSILEAAGTRI